MIQPVFNKLWLVTVGEPLPIDGTAPKLIRTGLMAEELCRRGVQVTWWSSTFDHFRKNNRFEKTTELRAGEREKLVLLHGPAYQTNISLRRIRNHRAIAHEFRRLLNRADDKPDAIVVSYPTIELAREAVFWGRARNVPVVVDVRDLWPDIFLDFIPTPLRWLGALALRNDFNAARYSFANASGIWGVSDGYLNFGLKYAGRQKSPVDAVIPIPVSRLRPAGPGDSAAKRSLLAKGVDPSKKIFWFVGSFAKTYDLLTVIRAARSDKIAALSNAIQFVFSGGGEKEAEWREAAAGLHNAMFTGWLQGDEVAAMGQLASFGLQAYAPGAPQGLANKLPDYLRFGLPILGSLKGENEEFLAAHECGLTYRAGDADDLAEKILRVLGDPSGAAAMARNASRAFETVFELERVCDLATEKLNELIESHAAEAARDSHSSLDGQARLPAGRRFTFQKEPHP